MYYRLSNTVIGILNLFTLLSSIPIIGAGLWMARSSSSNATACQSFLQTPLLVIGFVVLVLSLVGFIGACFHVSWALWLYLAVMLLLIAALLGVTLFGFAVTTRGGGTPVMGRVYREYHFEDYSPWLKTRINDPRNWAAVRSCILGSKSCEKIAAWTPVDYLTNNLTPIQSGCCKPPTACTYGDTAAAAAAISQDPDCYKWNNAPDILCYSCESCKAGVMESIRKQWHKVAVLLVVLLVLLVCIYSIACCAFRNARRAETGYPYGHSRITKVRPRWDYHWWRRFHDQRDRLY